ncbi:MAG: sulfatase-like hydrolase/transferase [Planctomycetota bacterium]
MKSSLLAILACLLLVPMALADRPPNLVLIVTDDQGYRDVGFNGGTQIPTPNLDRIANEGVCFQQGYVTYAVCGPSRAGLITGQYQDRFGGSLNPTPNPAVPNNGVPLTEKNLAELLKPKGYTSMIVGKWHLGTYPNLRPLVRGFDEFYGFLSGGHDYFPENLTFETLEDVNTKWGWYRTKLLDQEQRVGTTKYLTDELSDRAVDFIDRQKNAPFFLYLAYNAPHTPMQASEEYLARFSHIENEKRRTYAAMVASVDDGVGRVLDKLDEHGLAEDTLVVFLSDNGGATNNASNNYPLRGHKGSSYEGGIRVPFAMRWTGMMPAGVDYAHPVSALDVAGTIAAAAEVDVAADKPLDGVDLVPFVTGQADGRPHDTLVWRKYNPGEWVVRHGDEKLIHRKGVYELFDIAADTGETNNLAEKRPERVAALKALFDAWAEPMVPPAYPGLGSWTFD